MKMIQVLFYVSMLLLLACLDKGSVEDSLLPAHEGSVRVGIYVDTGDYQTPESRGAVNENSMYAADRMPWVFVFKGADNAATFVEAKQAVLVGRAATPYVTLTQQTGVVQLLLLCNAPATFSDGVSNYPLGESVIKGLLSGKTIQQVKELLQTVPYSAHTVPYSNGYLPMSGSFLFTRGITSTAAIGSRNNRVRLSRLLAKISIHNTASAITPATWTVVGAGSRSGFFQPLESHSLLHFDEGLASISEPFYVAENNRVGETMLILKATYRGRADNYYKLTFKDPVDGTLLPLVRNKWYKFNITKVGGYGYSSFSQALAGTPSNQITYTTTVVDEASYDLTDNGEYYLGASNSEWVIYGNNGAPFSMKAVSLITNATLAQVGAESNAITASGEGLILVGSHTVRLTTDATQPMQTNVRVRLSPLFTSGEIAIHLGRISKTVRITRVLQYGLDAAALPFGLTYHDSGRAYSAVTVPMDESGGVETPATWLTIAANGVDLVGEFSQPSPTSYAELTMRLWENTGETFRTASFFLTRQSSERVKVTVMQSYWNYENAYIVAPGSSIKIPLGRVNQSPLLLSDAIYNVASRAYEQLDATTAWTASLVWQSSVGLISLSQAGGRGPSRFFTVTAPDATKEGNAVVAIKHANGEILWSWHIWVTTYTGSNTLRVNSGNRVVVLMDRNLGAISATPGRLESNGLLYEWGRKDPFPGIAQEGGAWSVREGTDPLRVYRNNSTSSAYSIRRKFVSRVSPNNLTNAIREPDTYYCQVNSPFDWFVYDSSFEQNHDLWGGGNLSLSTSARKTVFDPCPKGWRVPFFLNGISPYEGLHKLSPSFGNYGVSFSGGHYIPASGSRGFQSGGLFSAGGYGYLWTASPAAGKAYRLYFDYYGVRPQNVQVRTDGCSVRCSRE